MSQAEDIVELAKQKCKPEREVSVETVYRWRVVDSPEAMYYMKGNIRMIS